MSAQPMNEQPMSLQELEHVIAETVLAWDLAAKADSTLDEFQAANTVSKLAAKYREARRVTQRGGGRPMNLLAGMKVAVNFGDKQPAKKPVECWVIQTEGGALAAWDDDDSGGVFRFSTPGFPPAIFFTEDDAGELRSVATDDLGYACRVVHLREVAE